MPSIAELREEIERYRRAGAWRKVVELCEELLAQLEEPRERSELMVYIAEVAYYQLDQRAGAISWLESAVDAASDFEPPLRWLQKLYREDDNWQAEMKLLAHYANSDAPATTRVGALHRMAEIAEQRNADRAEAIDYLNQALDETFRAFPAFDQLVRILREGHEWDRLETQYRKMIARSKSLTYSLNRQLGEVQERLRNAQKSVREVEVTSTIRLSADLVDAVPQSIEIADSLFQKHDGAAATEQGAGATPAGADARTGKPETADSAPPGDATVVTGSAVSTPEREQPEEPQTGRATNETPTGDDSTAVRAAVNEGLFTSATTDELAVPLDAGSIDDDDSVTPTPRIDTKQLIDAIRRTDPASTSPEERELPKADWSAIEPTHPAIALEKGARATATGNVELRPRVHWEARLPTSPRVDLSAISDSARLTLYERLDQQRAAGDLPAAMDTLEELERLELDPAERLHLAIEMADVAQDVPEHVGRAEAALMRILESAPDNLAALERLLQLHLLLQDVPAAIDCLTRLIGLEEDAPRRAELQIALGQLYAASDELPSAIKAFGKALLDEPDAERAYEFLNDVVEMHGDWHKLEEIYLTLLSAPEILSPERLFTLNLATAELYRTRLMNLERAASYFEQCVGARPQELDLRETLCELYEILGLADEQFLERAIDHHRLILSLEPLRESTLHSLLEVQKSAGARDHALRIAQLLGATGRANEAERAFLEAHTRPEPPSFRHPLEDAHFASLLPVGMDARINRLMALISRLEYRFVPVQTPHDARVLGYGHQFRHLLQEISPLFERIPPEVFRTEGDDLRAIGKPIALVVGQALLSTPDAKRWSFLIGRALCRLRSEFFLTTYGPDAARHCIAAAVNFASGGERVTDTSQSLFFFDHFDRLGIEERQALRAAAEPLASTLDYDVERWVLDVELSCLRCGLFVCGDVQVALREARTLSLPGALDAETITHDLARFVLSDEYDDLRRTFSLSID